MDIQDWRSFLLPYDQAVDEMVVKFQSIANEYRKLGKYSPIEQVQGRVKSISSIMEKMAKQSISFEDLEERMSDMAGLRLICQFVEDIEIVVELIRTREDMTVIEETNYVDHSKPSGYRSYHMIVLYPVYSVLGLKKVRCEIQIRTLGMNFWSIIEHSLSYKYPTSLPADVTRRLKNAADAAFAMDQEMSGIRLDILEAQGRYQAKAKLVGDVMNNIQNIYENSEKIAMRRAQENLLDMIRRDELDGIRHFGSELDEKAEKNKIQRLYDN
ncbi:MAG: GTP pyrophosphokinase family protein [Lachnospiraceae bacterium]|nr:GTP pyrophosphokinase family protein [Lachnospiraceae bacterium]